MKRVCVCECVREVERERERERIREGVGERGVQSMHRPAAREPETEQEAA